MSDASIQAYLDGELAPSARAAVAAHLEGCGRCADELHGLAAISDGLAVALEELDDAPPDMERAYATLLRRADAPAHLAIAAAEPARNGAAPAHAGVSPSARLLTGSRFALARAAVLVLAFAGLASAAVPGSPVRGWLVTAWTVADERLRGGPAEPVAAPSEAPPSPAPDPLMSPGVAVPLAGGAVVFIFDEVPEGARMRIRMVDGERAAVRMDGPGPIPHFGTGPGRIRVSGGGATEYVVEIPRVAERARVESDGRVLFTKSGDQVNMRSGPASLGTEIVVPLRP